MLEAREDTLEEGGGGERKKSGFKSEVLAPGMSFTSGPADTPSCRPGPRL